MSEYYDKLLACEKRLRKVLITKTVLKNPNSVTSQYKIQAYRLLSHAEIEYYIENIVLYKVNLIRDLWQKQRILSESIAHLIVYNKQELPGPSPKLSEISSKNDFQFRINTILSSFEKIVKNNNGIKEKDVIPLLISIGVDYTQINQILLSNMSSFGTNRGHSAHNSTKVHQLINPNDEINMVKQIIEELKKIDDLILNLK